MDTSENLGSWDVLKYVAGSRIEGNKIVEPKPVVAPTMRDPSWMADARKQWLSVENDLLFEHLGEI